MEAEKIVVRLEMDVEGKNADSLGKVVLPPP